MKNKQVIKELIDALEECLADIEVRSYFEDEEDWKENLLNVLKEMDPSAFERLCNVFCGKMALQKFR